tara:strand:- start:6440 stop:6835 length:396 start_codon:yes stop_codon:yes gene_type:complete
MDEIEHYKKEQERTRIQKAKILEALEQTLGVVTPACKAVGISRSTFYKWKEEDPKFSEEVGKIIGLRLDFLENEMLRRIQNNSQGSNTLLMYELNNRGRERGYGNDQKIDITSAGKEIKAPSWVIPKEKPE